MSGPHFTGEPVLNVLIAVLLTWVMYYSVAVVLLVMSLVAAHIVTPEAALALVLVLGANIGSAIPQWLVADNDAPARRLAIVNIIVRGFSCLAILAFLP